MAISPLDEQGKAVDWWFLYKVPKLSKAGGDESASGYEYMYYDRKVGQLQKSPFQLTDGKGALDLVERGLQTTNHELALTQGSMTTPVWTRPSSSTNLAAKLAPSTRRDVSGASKRRFKRPFNASSESTSASRKSK